MEFEIGMQFTCKMYINCQNYLENRQIFNIRDAPTNMQIGSKIFRNRISW